MNFLWENHFIKLTTSVRSRVKQVFRVCDFCYKFSVVKYRFLSKSRQHFKIKNNFYKYFKISLNQFFDLKIQNKLE